MGLLNNALWRHYANRRTWLWVVAGVLAGAAAAQWTAPGHSDDARTDDLAVTAPVSTGRIAVKDPVTGAYRSPTSDEAAAIASQAPKSVAPMTVEVRPDGSRRLRANGQAWVSSIAHAREDGTVEVDCVDVKPGSAEGVANR